MIRFGAAVASSQRAREAAREAAAGARARLGDCTPVLAIAFGSAGYEDLDGVPAALEAELGPVPLTGGSAGSVVFDEHQMVPRGVVVALLGGPGVRAAVTSAPVASPALLDVVPAGARLLSSADAAAHEGFEEALCLVFAPGVSVDGDALVAAVRKGTGARMQLAGGVTGDDFTFDRTRVFAEGGARPDRVVLTGIFTAARPGLAARHGLRPAGPVHQVTRCEGPWLFELDGRRALDVWVADVEAAGGRPPRGAQELLLYLANHYALGLEVPGLTTPVIRTPIELRGDGAARVGSAVAEGTRLMVMQGTAEALLRASREAADLSRERAAGKPAGALVLCCSGRNASLGERFEEEPRIIARSLGVPLAGTCVYGEIARTHHEADAFHNMNAVVVTWPG